MPDELTNMTPYNGLSVVDQPLTSATLHQHILWMAAFVSRFSVIFLLTNAIQFDTLNIRFCGSSSVVELYLAKVEVAGSNPVSRSRKLLIRGGVAKW